MKKVVKVEKLIDFKKILIDVQPRSVGDEEDDDMSPDMPMLDGGGNWIATVDIDTGVIENWPKGDARSFYIKVSDCGTYALFDEKGEEVASINQGYVPNGIVPGEYGDYIDLQIDGSGKITNWPKNPSVNEFFED